MNLEKSLPEKMPKTGILPLNMDGFETGDYENFALVYVGDSNEWIHPRAEISADKAISGKYSLRWNADNREQKWMFISNAFHISKPYRVSVKIRINNLVEFEAGLLGTIESYNRQGEPRKAIVDALRLTDKTVRLDLKADATNWSSHTNRQKSITIKKGSVYTLSMAYSKHTVFAKVEEENNKQALASFNVKSYAETNAVGLFVHLKPSETGQVTFDDFQVNSAPYKIKSDEWRRSPQFVVLSRIPDTTQSQGSWVGAASAMHDESIYKLWYRIRKPDIRGVGFGYAMSSDAIHWQKHKDNPVLSFNRKKYLSCEKISVLKINGLYKAWYTVHTPGIPKLKRPQEWHIVYATSIDGVNWSKQGEVLSDGYYKDPDVIFVNGTYYMYVIHPNAKDLSVLSSMDGVNWSFRSKISTTEHSHPAAYYVEETNKFWLYEDTPELRAASSEDGVNFGEFQTIMTVPPVGLDDNHFSCNGVNYPTFFRDGFGHLDNDKNILMVYQARHAYLNNRPSWKFAEDGKLVLSGKFSGFHINVPTEIDIKGNLTYSVFPIHCQKINGLKIETDVPLKINVNFWKPYADKAGSLTVSSFKSNLKLNISRLRPNSEYKLLVDKKVNEIKTTDKKGTVEYKVQINGQQNLCIIKNNNTISS